jgi:uncharacterized protein
MTAIRGFRLILPMRRLRRAKLRFFMTGRRVWGAGKFFLSGAKKMNEKLIQLRAILKSYGSVLIAFSGGTDSAFVLKVARDVLGRENVKAATARSASLPLRELEAAGELARSLDVEHLILETKELEKPGYSENTAARCYFCKETLYEILRPLAVEQGLREICNGTNADDLGDYRPGLKAAENFAIKSPLVEAGFTKQDVRDFSRVLGLSTWEKPAQACLSSRIPYGEKVTEEKLAQVEKAENFLRDKGLTIIRVRHHGTLARIEAGPEDIKKFYDENFRREIAEAFQAFGFLYITLDLQGYRTGSFNQEILYSSQVFKL